MISKSWQAGKSRWGLRLLGVLIGLNLMPMAWLVGVQFWSKGLEGLSFSYVPRSNEILSIESRREGALVTSRDGGVLLVGQEGGALVTKGERNFSENGISSSLLGDELWLLSGEAGLRRMDATTLSVREHWDRETLCRNAPLDQQESCARASMHSSVLATPQTIYLTWQQAPGILLFDPVRSTGQWLAFGRDLPFGIQKVQRLSEDRAAFVGEQGVVVWNLRAKRAMDQFAWRTDMGMTAPRWLVEREDSLLIPKGAELGVFSYAKRAFTRQLGVAEGLDNAPICGIFPAAEQTWVVSHRAVRTLDNTPHDFGLRRTKPVDQRVWSNPISQNVSAFTAMGGEFWLGSREGKIAFGTVSSSRLLLGQVRTGPNHVDWADIAFGQELSTLFHAALARFVVLVVGSLLALVGWQGRLPGGKRSLPLRFQTLAVSFPLLLLFLSFLMQGQIVSGLVTAVVIC